MQEISELIDNICASLQNDVDHEALQKIRNRLFITLSDFNWTKKETAIVVLNQQEEMQALKKFFAVKKLEGLAKSSLTYYHQVLKKFREITNKNLLEIMTDDVRLYLAMKSEKVTNVTLNNERRVLNSFYSFLIEEEFISKNPITKIKNIKEKKKIKEALKEEELEKLRAACTNKRDKAMLELLYSTGCRVSEVSNITIKDINLGRKEIKVLGKGNKERIVFINTKCKILLEEYFLERGAGENEPAFVSLRKKDGQFQRLSKGAIECWLRKLGESIGIEKVHPHKLRRTMATNALNKGMPIPELQILLGHASIQTTTIYAKADTQEIKRSHEKYV